MPAAIPVLAGGASIAGGMAASSMVVKGLMIGGGVLSIAGGITGNQTLTQLGGLASMGGGLAGMATGAFSGAGSAGSAGGTGLTAQASQSSNITDMIAGSAGAGGSATGAGNAAQGLQMGGTASGVSSGVSTGAGNAGQGILAGSMGSAAGASGSSGGFMSNVGGFIRDNADLMKIGGEAISGAMDRKAQEDMLALQQDHERAMKQKDYDLARELEEEMFKRRNDSITGLRPMDETMRASDQDRPVTRGFQNVMQPGGLLAREWQPRGATA